MIIMKIYFAGSIRGGRDDKELYAQLIEHLKTYGQVLTEHIGDQTLSALGEDGPNDEFIYNRDMDWIKEADVLVAEVTTPSLGVGYELGCADGKMNVLCLYRKQDSKRLSAMIGGNSSFKNVEYETLDEAKSLIDEFLD